METVQQNGRFTLFSIKFLSIYSILYDQQSDIHKQIFGFNIQQKPFYEKSQHYHEIFNSASTIWINKSTFN